jgi:dTDP-glucose 4,6-dehydratase
MSGQSSSALPGSDPGRSDRPESEPTVVGGRPSMTVLVTGGLGFIGSALVRRLIDSTDHQVANVDKVSYASTWGSVADAAESPRYSFHRCDLVDQVAIAETVAAVEPDAIVHLAAESHVDRSIDGPRAFLESNVVGTFNLLEAARALPTPPRFVHVSTDEVFGSLADDDPRFDQNTPYDPRSPYSATKAASDHLVRAWGETFGLPVTVVNCSNNYGPFQFPEKMIPLMITKAWNGERLPVYGLGLNVRDWLHVDDHARALVAVLERGTLGQTYTVGGDSERTNIEVVQAICDLVNARSSDSLDRRTLIEFVADRPGHDLRYGVDSTRIRAELGWRPQFRFEAGLAATVDWYLANRPWWDPLVVGQDASVRLGLMEVK